MHLFTCLSVTDFVHKMGARPGLAKEPLIPFNIHKMDFLPNRLSVTNDDLKRGCVAGDHCFKYGCFPIYIQYLKTALGRILYSSVVMVLAFGARGHWFESCPDLIILPCIYSFVSWLRTLFVRKETVVMMTQHFWTCFEEKNLMVSYHKFMTLSLTADDRK